MKTSNRPSNLVCLSSSLIVALLIGVSAAFDPPPTYTVTADIVDPEESPARVKIGDTFDVSLNATF